MFIKSSPLKGCKDRPSDLIFKREYLFQICKKHFTLMGFTPLETPAMESLSVLTGKYGTESNKLLFKILRSGEHSYADKGLRYDLTVPLARYVYNNKQNLTFPYRRFQIQPVWRSERPQKGRYREFYQCDADIIGDHSPMLEVELLSLLHSVFTDLRITDFTISINHKKILSGIVESLDETSNSLTIVRTLDKLDKIGSKLVLQELSAKGIKESSLERLSPLLEGETGEKGEVTWGRIGDLLKNSEIGLTGLNVLKRILSLTKSINLSSIVFDPTLARGLDYYTGTIFEVKLKNSSIGSVAGGGRYDDLTRMFGKDDLTGVGVSFGVERLCDILEERKLFPKDLNKKTDVLIINFDGKEMDLLFSIATDLRKKFIVTELYPSPKKLKNQIKYADDKNISFVVIRGPEEREQDIAIIKNMRTGEQELVQMQYLLHKIEGIFL